MEEFGADNQQLWETECEALLLNVAELNGLVRRALEEIECLGAAKSKLKELEEGVKELEEKVEQEKKELEEMMKIEKQKLILGQVAFDIDRSVPKQVLDSVVGP